VLVVLADDPVALERRGFTPERQAESLAARQREFGMPLDPRPRARMAATLPACRAVVAAQVHAPEAAEPLLRRLRVLWAGGALLDDAATLAQAASEAGLEPERLLAWTEEPEVRAALREGMREARAPEPPALALPHKLGAGGRYSTPSYRFSRGEGERLVAPGFQPFAALELLLANLAPELERRAPAETAAEALAWAGEPLATAEVAALTGRDLAQTRAELAGVAAQTPVGADGFWSLASAMAASR